ncbi:MAG: hypothetical protein E7469_03375 [Ruminococcaceae bacterium]|nr:hypothetical protein [Oscillospiraceae bacterium]
MKKLIHILYPLYAAVCLAACLAAERVYQWARNLALNFMSITASLWLMFLPIFLLGILWAAEQLLAARVGKRVLLVTRLVTMAVLLVWTLYTMYVPITLPEWFHPIGYAPYVIVWFLLGWLIVSTIALLVKKKDA